MKKILMRSAAWTMATGLLLCTAWSSLALLLAVVVCLGIVLATSDKVVRSGKALAMARDGPPTVAGVIAMNNQHAMKIQRRRRLAQGAQCGLYAFNANDQGLLRAMTNTQDAETSGYRTKNPMNKRMTYSGHVTAAA